jgi:uncharacterized linocin/CFP29 family protein
MTDYLMRDGAPISEHVWHEVDEMVARVVSRVLVARRFMPLVGPLGWGVEVAPRVGFTTVGNAYVSNERTEYVPLEAITALFLLRLQEIARADQTPFHMDLGAVATAAVELARREDEIIIGGLIESAEHGAIGNWSEINGPFESIVGGLATMRATGFDGPFALVLNYGTYARLASLMLNGIREIDAVERLVEVGIFQTPAVPEGQALLVSPQSWNMDMVVGQDISTAFLGNDKLSLAFQITETLALRIKRPGASLLLA